MKTLKKIFKKNKVFFFNYNRNSFFEGFYRFCAILISPLFLKFNPNFISLMSLVCGLLGLLMFVFYSLSLKLILIFFVLSFILDFTDGLVARTQKKSSFYGRFIDGLFDIFVFGFLHLVFLIYLVKNSYFSEDNFFYIFYLITIFLLPIQHLILDRFSSLARWSNEINKKKLIKPYYRNDYFNKITMLFVDLQHLSIFFILISKNFNLIFILNFFFIISFLSSLFSIMLYFNLSKNKLKFTSNQKDNNE